MNRSSIFRFAPVLASAVLLEGCASILSGKRQALPLESDPPEASATWSGQEVVTPGALVVPRKTEGIRIRFEKPGYAPCAVTLERDHDGSYWTNLVLIPAGMAAGGAIGNALSEPHGWFDYTGGIVGAAVGGLLLPLGGMGIDKGTGAAYRHQPGKVAVVLAPVEPGREVGPVGKEPECAVRAKSQPGPERPSTPTVSFVPGASSGNVRITW